MTEYIHSLNTSKLPLKEEISITTINICNLLYLYLNSLIYLRVLIDITLFKRKLYISLQNNNKRKLTAL